MNAIAREYLYPSISIHCCAPATAKARDNFLSCSGRSLGGQAMQSARVGNDHSVAQLVEAEWGVREINELIDRQRELIEELEERRFDLTSAKIVLDSFIVTLTLLLARARSASCGVNAKMTEAVAA